MKIVKPFLTHSISTSCTSTHLGLGVLFLRFFGAFALLRTHGWPKLMDFEGTVAHIPDPIGMGQVFSAYYAIFANVFCAFLVMFGLFTRWASAVVVSITLSGLFIVHATDSAKVQDTPFIYSIVFITLIILGSGKYALDAVIEKKINS
ncbi:MAG: DoxX family protein [Bacteroidota bacterium]